MLSLKPASAKVVPCKICQQSSTLFGLVDFNRNCQIPGGVKLPLTGTPVYYRRCDACGFLFTDAFDDWSQEDFKTHIYNDDYHAVDPGYVLTRPRDNAAVVQQVFGVHKMILRVLDYGGGNDVLCSQLRAAGFPVATTYDPFVPEYANAPEGKFNLVTCFETLEHMPDPLKGIGAIVEYLAGPVFDAGAAAGLRQAWHELVVCRPAQWPHFVVQPRCTRERLAFARLPNQIV